MSQLNCVNSIKPNATNVGNTNHVYSYTLDLLGLKTLGRVYLIRKENKGRMFLLGARINFDKLMSEFLLYLSL